MTHRAAATQQVASAGSSDWWLAGGVAAADVLGAWQGIAADSQAASLVNLNDPGTNDLTEIETPTWDTSYGWDCRTIGRLESGIVAAEGISLIVRYSGMVNTSSGTVRSIAGTVATSGAHFGIDTYCIGTIARYEYRSGGVLTSTHYEPPANLPASGVVAVAGQTAYRNAHIVGTIPTWTASTASTVRIGGFSGHSSRSCIIQAAAVYDTVLTADQIAAITAAMEAL